MAAPVQLPGVYDLLVEYANIANPTEKWRNTYTFSSQNPPQFGQGIIGAIGGLAIALVHSDAQIVNYACYNWVRGRQPYPFGTPLFSVSVAAPGEADVHWPHLAQPYTPVGGEVCLSIIHNSLLGGRPGRSFLRGLLGRADVSATSGGKWSSVPTLANLQSDWSGIVVASGLVNYYSPGSGGQELVIVRYSPKTNTVHGATAIAGSGPIGVTTNKLTRKGRR